MRIVGGKHKGRKLYSPIDDDVRPTLDKVRESLFNILGQYISGTFYDLFGGSGAVGIEAYSRGATVTINDGSKKSIDIIRKNVALVTDKDIKVTNYDYKTAIKLEKTAFNYIFLDPPYKLDIQPVVDELLNKGLINEDTIVIYEHNSDKSDEIRGLTLNDSRKYGYCIISFYKKEKN